MEHLLDFTLHVFSFSFLLLNIALNKIKKDVRFGFKFNQLLKNLINNIKLSENHDDEISNTLSGISGFYMTYSPVLLSR